jgi:predicted dehydrogenase/catechol 2,3-dioxygenase-like lactoylglutathione lyase family enzyme
LKVNERAIKIGLIGNGHQIRNWHLPYLENRSRVRGDVEIAWAGGCLCRSEEQEACPIKHYRPAQICCEGRSRDWLELLDSRAVDAVIVSTPNTLHYDAIRAALDRDVCVAVDKPTTETASSSQQLVALAEERDLVFATLAQRRYEALYRTVRDIVSNGELGDVRLIDYVTAHGFFNADNELFRADKALAGGGALLDSAYHGIDIALWLLRSQRDIHPLAVSARMDYLDGNPESIELTAAARASLSNGALFNITTSYLAPRKSVDEHLFLYGSAGTVRIMRHRLDNNDMSAAGLSYQSRDGDARTYDTSRWVGDRQAPVADFVEAVIARAHGDPWQIDCPARDSVPVLQIIDAAYTSDREAGREVTVTGESPFVQAVDHVAVQSQHFDKAVEFYTRVLGAELLGRRPFKKREIAWLRVGSTKIELFSSRKGEKLQEWSDYHPGPVHIAFKVDNLGRFLDRALEAGARYHPSHPAPFTPPVPGARPIAYLLGADGEEIEIRDS